MRKSKTIPSNWPGRTAVRDGGGASAVTKAKNLVSLTLPAIRHGQGGVAATATVEPEHNTRRSTQASITFYPGGRFISD